VTETRDGIRAIIDKVIGEGKKMKLNEMREAAYGVRLYKMPSDEDIRREARWGDSSFTDLKQGYELLWRQRRSLTKICCAGAI
jgi:hypothetical protein